MLGDKKGRGSLGRAGGVCTPITESGKHGMEIIGGLELRINDRDDSLGKGWARMNLCPLTC